MITERNFNEKPFVIVKSMEKTASSGASFTVKYYRMT